MLAMKRGEARPRYAGPSLAVDPSREDWTSCRLDLADQPKPQNRATSDIPNAARSVSRASLQLGAGVLLRVRAAGLSTRLAQGSVGHRTKQECGMALRLRHRLAILECTEQRGGTPASPARAALRPNRWTALEGRRGRSHASATYQSAFDMLCPDHRLAGLLAVTLLQC
jgi:hypothetical protein